MAAGSSAATVRGGKLELSEDVLVPAGETMLLQAGTTVVFGRRRGGAPGWSAALFDDPARRRLADGGRVHLIVQGALEIDGRADAPVTFGGERWGGIVVLGRGEARFSHARFEKHDVALQALDRARVRATACRFFSGRGAVAAEGLGRVVLDSVEIDSCEEFGARLEEESRARVRRTSFSGCRLGLFLRDHARAALSSCRFQSNEQGAIAERDAELACLRGRWSTNRLAASIRGGARARFHGDELRENGFGLECLGEARVGLNAVIATGQGTAVWAQNETELELSGGRFEENAIGLKLSHKSKARVRGTDFSDHGKAALMLEERARAELFGARLERERRGAVLLQEALLSADDCSWSGPEEKAVWREPLCRVRLERCRFHPVP